MFEIGLKLPEHRGRQIEITSPPERRASFDLVDFYCNESQLIGLDTLKREAYERVSAGSRGRVILKMGGVRSRNPMIPK